VLAFFSRIPRCVVGLEACATAHYWARELGALGHEVRLMPAQYVKAYIKRNKHDAADAEAICGAVQRPTMRFCAGQDGGAAGEPVAASWPPAMVNAARPTILFRTGETGLLHDLAPTDHLGLHKCL
jgi:hypothetical protein